MVLNLNLHGIRVVKTGRLKLIQSLRFRSIVHEHPIERNLNYIIHICKALLAPDWDVSLSHVYREGSRTMD